MVSPMLMYRAMSTRRGRRKKRRKDPSKRNSGMSKEPQEADCSAMLSWNGSLKSDLSAVWLLFWGGTSSSGSWCSGRRVPPRGRCISRVPLWSCAAIVQSYNFLAQNPNNTIIFQFVFHYQVHTNLWSFASTPHHYPFDNHKPCRPLETRHCVVVQRMADCQIPGHHLSALELDFEMTIYTNFTNIWSKRRE